MPKEDRVLHLYILVLDCPLLSRYAPFPRLAERIVGLQDLTPKQKKSGLRSLYGISSNPCGDLQNPCDNQQDQPCSKPSLDPLLSERLHGIIDPLIL